MVQQQHLMDSPTSIRRHEPEVPEVVISPLTEAAAAVTLIIHVDHSKVVVIKTGAPLVKDKVIISKVVAIASNHNVRVSNKVVAIGKVADTDMGMDAMIVFH